MFVFVRAPAPWIERWYANGFYPIWDRSIRGLVERSGVSVGDVALLVLVSVGLVAGMRRLGVPRRFDARAVPKVALRSFALLAIIFNAFMISWGLSYGRIPLAEKIRVDGRRTTARSVTALADRTVDNLSRYALAAHASPLDDATIGMRLRPTFEATIGRLGDGADFAPPRIKPTIFARFMSRSGTTGFTDPWTHEVNLAPNILPIERAAIYAHEWAHVAGFADEAEANFIAVIACTTARDVRLRYSGWLLVWENLPPNVRVTHRLAPAAYEDLRAIAARYRRDVDPATERIQRAAYDRYLKSNHVGAGIESYGLFVRWLTGGDFDSQGLPIRVGFRSRTNETMALVTNPDAGASR